MLFVFFIVFFFSWAAGVWMTPFGPAVYNVYIMPYILFGLLIAILLVAVAAPEKRVSPPPAEPEETAAGAVFGLFFWVLIVGLLVAVVVKYSTG